MHGAPRGFAQALLERPGSRHDHVHGASRLLAALGQQARRPRKLLHALFRNEPAGGSDQQRVLADAKLAAEIAPARRVGIRVGVDGVGKLPGRREPEMPQPRAGLFRNGEADRTITLRAHGHRVLDGLDRLTDGGAPHGQVCRSVLDEHGRYPKSPREGEPLARQRVEARVHHHVVRSLRGKPGHGAPVGVVVVGKGIAPAERASAGKAHHLDAGSVLACGACGVQAACGNRAACGHFRICARARADVVRVHRRHNGAALQAGQRPREVFRVRFHAAHARSVQRAEQHNGGAGLRRGLAGRHGGFAPRFRFGNLARPIISARPVGRPRARPAARARVRPAARAPPSPGPPRPRPRLLRQPLPTADSRFPAFNGTISGRLFFGTLGMVP